MWLLRRFARGARAGETSATGLGWLRARLRVNAGDPLTTGDNTLELYGLRNGLTGEPVNTAIVRATITDDQGIRLQGASVLTLASVSGSEGTYRAQLRPSAGFIVGRTYHFRAAVVLLDGLRDTFGVSAVAVGPSGVTPPEA